MGWVDGWVDGWMDGRGWMGGPGWKCLFFFFSFVFFFVFLIPLLSGGGGVYVWYSVGGSRVLSTSVAGVWFGGVGFRDCTEHRWMDATRKRWMDGWDGMDTLSWIFCFLCFSLSVSISLSHPEQQQQQQQQQASLNCETNGVVSIIMCTYSRVRDVGTGRQGRGEEGVGRQADPRVNPPQLVAGRCLSCIYHFLFLFWLV